MTLASRLVSQPSHVPNSVRLNVEFDVEPVLALAWIDSLLAAPPMELALAADDLVELLVTRNELVRWGCGIPVRQRDPLLHVIALRSLERRFRQIARERRDQLQEIAAAERAQLAPALEPTLPPFLERLSDELSQATFAGTNLAANISTAALFLDASYQSLPIGVRVRLQGGQWELYDRNSTARRNSRGKLAKLRYPPRMALRARGVNLHWLTARLETLQARGGGLRIDVPGAKTLHGARRLARLNALQMIPKAAYGALPLRGVLGGNAVGLVLTIGPQAFVDARAANLFETPGDRAAWERFAIASARNQSGNAAGIVASVGLALLFTAVTGVVAAPVLIAVGLGAGVLGQATFNAAGFDEKAEAAARALLDR
jgi:hypothetical protein